MDYDYIYSSKNIDIKCVPVDLIQTLSKKYLNDYQPDYDGIVFDGFNVYGGKKYNITPCQAKKFMLEVENYFTFTIDSHTIIEESINHSDLYIYYTKHFIDKGFDLRGD